MAAAPVAEDSPRIHSTTHDQHAGKVMYGTEHGSSRPFVCPRHGRKAFAPRPSRAIIRGGRLGTGFFANLPGLSTPAGSGPV